MKHLKLFLEYITINQGANLTTKDPSASDVKQKHKYQKKKNKEKSKESKIIQSITNLTHSSNFGNNGQGNSPGGGGADY